MVLSKLSYKYSITITVDIDQYRLVQHHYLTRYFQFLFLFTKQILRVMKQI